MQWLRHRLRDAPGLRATLVPLLALRVRPDLVSDWLAVVMYHDVPAGSERPFARQLAAMRGFGDFIDLETAVAGLRERRPMAGRHICITFDDGHASDLHRALPILREFGAVSAHFVVAAWIGQPGRLTWDDCRSLRAESCVVGSHSLTHARLAALDDAQVSHELSASRAQIAAELGGCDHFACPWGQPDEDYRDGRDPGLAERAGYLSFLTTIRGRARSGTGPYAIPRIRLEPGWGMGQLRYALFR